MSLFVGLPSYDGTRFNALALAEVMATRKDATLNEVTGCYLCANRNDLWCQALNMSPRPERFLWLDADVLPVPVEGFVDVLEAEMARVGADVLGAVVAMKQNLKATSVGIDGAVTRRLLLSEILGRPVTWTDPGLVLPMGMVLVDFTKPWVEKVSFSMVDSIRRREDGRFVTDVDGEDFRWCRAVRKEGASIWVTRKLGTIHVGRRDHEIPAAR